MGGERPPPVYMPNAPNAQSDALAEEEERMIAEAIARSMLEVHHVDDDLLAQCSAATRDSDPYADPYTDRAPAYTVRPLSHWSCMSLVIHMNARCTDRMTAKYSNSVSFLQDDCFYIR